VNLRHTEMAKMSYGNTKIQDTKLRAEKYCIYNRSSYRSSWTYSNHIGASPSYPDSIICDQSSRLLDMLRQNLA